MSKLKPCPFCGGEAELTGFDAPEYWVWCPNCKASTDAHTGKMNAIEAWNTRYDPQLDAIPATEENMARYGWVHVVRCRDCTVYNGEGYGCSYGRGDDPDGFCAWGTPKNSETTPKAMDEPVEVWNQWSTDDVTCWEVDK